MRTKIHITVSFVILMTILLLFFSSKVTTFSIIVSFIHETGHIIAILIRGKCINSLKFRAFAVEIVLDCTTLSYFDEAFISAAGPLINIFCCLATFHIPGCESFAVCSGVIGAFHLIPAEGLDGGNCLRALISATKEREMLLSALKFFSVVLATLLTVYGAAVFFITKANISVLVIGAVLLCELIMQKDKGRFE